MSKNYLLMPGGFQSMLRLRAYLSLMAKQMYQYTSRPIKRTKYNLAIDNVSSLGEGRGGGQNVNGAGQTLFC